MIPTISNRPFEALQLDQLQPPVRGVILDGDGVLWRDTQPIGDLPAAFAAMRKRGLAITLATNNAMLTVDDYQAKLHGFGVEMEAWQIVTAGEATADVLLAAFPHGGSVYIVGEHGLELALKQRGFEVVSDPSIERPYVAVIGGIDREFTYARLQKAAGLIRAGAPFYGTNPDVTFPTPEGLMPGAGAVLAALKAAAGREPIIVGKPSALLFQTAAERMQLTPESVLVVGDRLETDIAGGQAFGARTAAVLTGVSTSEQAAAWRPPPTIIARSLEALLGLG